jgi:hypothetical protein
MSKLTVRYEGGVSEYDETRRALIVEHGGVEISNEVDSGEPEDNTFGRDWSWIKPLLERVYALGVADGKETP